MNLHSLIEKKSENIEVHNRLQKIAANNSKTLALIFVLFIITWVFIVATGVLSQWLG